ncbi:MAG: DNA polymerase-3 subunit alpha, partial [Halioglobus sp.]
MTDFVHLRLHSEYSLIDGLVRIKPLVKRLVDLDMPAVAITDHSNFFGLVKLYKAAIRSGIKPIFGVDLKIVDSDDEEQSYPISLLAMDEEGYRNLTILISKSYTEGQYLGAPFVRKAWLEEYSAGVIAMSAGAA